jgi:NADP-dependent 3-hydroxy acid dehydrogenase YdfG
MSGGARRALVTGASAGIGEACAGELPAAGWAVTGASRRGTAWGGGLAWSWTSAMTIRCAPGWRACWPPAAGSTRLSLALGGGLAGAIGQPAIGEAKAQLETSFWGCVRVLQQVLQRMRAHGGGRIVLRSSIGGVIGIPFGAFYSAGKFTLGGRGEALASEVAPLGVHVMRAGRAASRRTSRPAAGWRRRLAAIRSTAPPLPGPPV